MSFLTSPLVSRIIKLVIPLIIITLAGPVLWDWAAEKVKPKPTPKINLSCDDNFRELPLTPGETTIIVPPGDCWSEQLVVPFQANHLLIRPTNTIWEKVTFPDGTEEEFEYGPLLRKKDARLITGVRFKNLHKEPVTVKVSY